MRGRGRLKNEKKNSEYDDKRMILTRRITSTEDHKDHEDNAFDAKGLRWMSAVQRSQELPSLRTIRPLYLSRGCSRRLPLHLYIQRIVFVTFCVMVFFRARSRFCNPVLRMNLARGSFLFGALSQSKRERSECRAIISGACGAGWNRDQRDRFESGQVVKQGNTKKHLNRRSQRSQRITIVENHPNALRSSTADSRILRLSRGNTKKFLEQKITQSHHF
jgi:hypothetical protein